MKFYNKQYPNGMFLYDGRIERFTNGVYETEESEKIKHLQTKVKNLTWDKGEEAVEEVVEEVKFELKPIEDYGINDLKQIAKDKKLTGWTALDKEKLYEFIKKNI